MRSNRRLVSGKPRGIAANSKVAAIFSGAPELGADAGELSVGPGLPQKGKHRLQCSVIAGVAVPEQTEEPKSRGRARRSVASAQSRTTSCAWQDRWPSDGVAVRASVAGRLSTSTRAIHSTRGCVASDDLTERRDSRIRTQSSNPELLQPGSGLNRRIPMPGTAIR